MPKLKFITCSISSNFTSLIANEINSIIAMTEFVITPTQNHLISKLIIHAVSDENDVQKSFTQIDIMNQWCVVNESIKEIPQRVDRLEGDGVLIDTE